MNADDAGTEFSSSGSSNVSVAVSSSPSVAVRVCVVSALDAPGVPDRTRAVASNVTPVGKAGDSEYARSPPAASAW